MAFGCLASISRHRHRVRDDLGVDARLAHPPRDQLGVLRAEVDHQDQVVFRHDGSLLPRRVAQPTAALM